MNIKSLNNVTRKILLPKFPWIEDFEWKFFTYDGYNYYTLEVIPEMEFTKSQIFMDRFEVEIEDEIKSLFQMLAPATNEKFNRVQLSYYL